MKEFDPTVLPFPRSYWIIPGKFLAGHVPTDKNQEISDEKIKNLVHLKINCFINLQEENETDEEGRLFPEYDKKLKEIFHQKKYSFHRCSIKDLSVPDKEQMINILNIIDKELNNGNRIYLHCWGGIGRTGTVVGCFLMRHKMASKKNVISVIKYLRRTDPKIYRDSPETKEQMDFVIHWKE